jgi:hypothetical protein
VTTSASPDHVPSTRVGLIQLVSEEAMPSFLPVLALHPAALVHITSDGFERHSAPVLAAAEMAGLRPTSGAVRELRLQAMPSIAETHQAVKDAIEWLHTRGLTPVINFTGGTKLMSIGAFYAAVSANMSSLYVDGDHETFVDGRTGPEIASLLENELRLGRLAPRLSVPLIVAAHGGCFQSNGRDFAPLVPLAQHLLAHPDDEMAVWETLFGENGRFSKLQHSREKRDWLRSPEMQFTLPKRVRELAEAAGLISVRNGTARLKCDEPEAIAIAAESNERLLFEDIQRFIAPCRRG